MDRRSFLTWSAVSPVSVTAGALGRPRYRQSLPRRSSRPLPTGLRNLDYVLRGGLTPGAVTLLGATPGRGIVHPLTLSIIDHHLQREGRPVAFVTAYVSRDDLLWRLASMRAGVPCHISRHGLWQDDRQRRTYEETRQAIEESALHYESIRRLRTFDDLARSLRKVHVRHPLALVVIDDVGEFKDLRCAQVPERAAGNVGRAMQHLARAVEAPILAVHWFFSIARPGEWSDDPAICPPPDQVSLGHNIPMLEYCDAFLIVNRLPVEWWKDRRFTIDVSFHPRASTGDCSCHTIDASTWRVQEGA